MSKRRRVRIGVVLFAVLLVCAGWWLLSYFHLLPQKSYQAEDFGIQTVLSDLDCNQNGVDDYTDMVLGARNYVQTKPHYRSAYYEGGYPPEGEGVCTDVIWKAFEAAGYSLKDLVDADIAANVDLYPRVEGNPDPNIDFRRVKNLKVFFDRRAISLTLDPSDLAAWQPGDIVVYPSHIALVSDKRNKDGVPYIIHNGGQPVLEEDALTRMEIIGHYRWHPNSV